MKISNIFIAIYPACPIAQHTGGKSRFAKYFIGVAPYAATSFRPLGCNSVKKIILWMILAIGVFAGERGACQNIGINTTGATPNASALLDIDASPGNDKGLLIPRLTTAQMNAISTPATGLIIYNIDCNTFNYYNGNTWIAIGNTGSVTTPGAITGSATPCQNATGIAYSITAVSGATGYNWTAPAGATVATGQGTISVTVDFATTDGNVCVTASNACGTSNASCTAITLQSAPAAPTATAASNIAQTSFDANWNASAGATTYYLDVATDAGFTSFVTGYNNLNVGNVTTYGVTGLTCNTTYYYRVRAGNSCGTSSNSNTITVTTGGCCPSFSDDFSGTDNWTDVGTLNSVNTGTDVIDWDGVRNSTNSATSYDLTSISDVAWIVRFKLTIDNISLPSSESSHHIAFILSSSSGSVNSMTARDYIGFTVHDRNQAGSHIKNFRIMDGDGVAWAQPAIDDFTATPAAGNSYYVQIVRTSSTAYTVSMYSNAAFTTLVESKNATCAATTAGLRYIVIQNDNNSTVAATFDGTIDDVQFCDGVTSF